MFSSHSFLLLLVFNLFVHAISAQFTQGTLVFKEVIDTDWADFESKMLQPYIAEIDASDQTKTEKEQAKAELLQQVKIQLDNLRQLQSLSQNDSTIYIFTEHQAVAERMDGGKPRDEFWDYNLDSSLTNLYTLKNGKVTKRVITFPSQLSQSTQINVRDSVIMDRNDQKTIAGFPCFKYRIYHSHYLKGGDIREEYQYDLYVTDAIILPSHVLEPEITLPAGFKGCVLEFRRSQPGAPFSILQKAVSFSPKVGSQKFVLPQKFKG